MTPLPLRLIPPEAWQTVFALVKIVVDPKAVKRHLRQLHDALAAIAAAQQKLEAQGIELEAKWAADRAELEQERASLQRRRLNVEAMEGRLDERHKAFRAASSRRNLAAWKKPSARMSWPVGRRFVLTAMVKHSRPTHRSPVTSRDRRPPDGAAAK
jgi:hypothetical protein